MLLAEDLLLLLTDDDTGKLATDSTEVDVALGGALLVELTLTHRVDVAGPDERVREGRLVVRDPNPTGDGLLDQALAIVGQKEGKKAQSVVERLGKRVRVRLYERLAEGGVLRAEEGRVLGIFRRIGGPPRTLPTRRRSGRNSSRPSAMAQPQRQERVRSSRCCSR